MKGILGELFKILNNLKENFNKLKFKKKSVIKPSRFVEMN